MDNQKPEEIEVETSEIIFFLLGKWRSLIVCIVIGLVLGVLLYMRGYISEKKEYQAEYDLAWEEYNEAVLEQEQAIEEAELVAELAAEAEAVDYREVMAAGYEPDPDTLQDMELAIQYRKLYALQQEYLDNSVKMQFGTKGVYLGEVMYYISGCENIDLIISLYTDFIFDDGILEEVREASGFDCDLQYIRELITVTGTKRTYSNVTMYEESYEGAEQAAIISISVYSNDEESCLAMLDVLAGKWNEFDVSFSDFYGSYDQELMHHGVSLRTATEYLEARQKYLGYLNTYYTNFTKLENTFSDEDTVYYRLNYLADFFGIGDSDWIYYIPEDSKTAAKTAQAVFEEIEEPEIEEMAPPAIKLQLAIGLIALILIWVLWHVFEYFKDGKVKNAAEFDSVYGLPVIGRLGVRESGSRNRIDRLIKKMYLRYRGPQDNMEYVLQVLKNVLCGGAVLCCDCVNDETGGVMDHIKAGMEGVSRGTMSSLSLETLKMSCETGTEVIVACIGNSSRELISREIECCRLNGIKILGVICVEENE